MALFGKKKDPSKTGGLMNVIRCDEESYLIWKWRPMGNEANSTNRENSIPYGSSLRVKDGEVAVFVYRQKDGTVQDYIEGPFDDTVKTANFPVLSSIVGLAFGGASPFQAEVYFINLADVIQIKFGVPYFDVFDPRFLDFAVPVAVRGTVSFKIADYREFIKLHRLVNFDLESFKAQVKDAIMKYVKGAVTNSPHDNGIPVMQIERKALRINEIVEARIKPRMQNDFGVLVSAVDIGAIETDKESEGYRSLTAVTRDIASDTTRAQADVNIQNMADIQRINSGNLQATLAIQREEMQYAQRMQTDAANFAVHQLNQQTQVAMAGAQAMGQMGRGGDGNMDGGGMNPGAMIAGMAMGGAVGQQMAGMMGNMIQGVNNPQTPGGTAPPPVPTIQYNVAVNGQSTGPFTIEQLAQMAQSGHLTPQSMVWKQGMSNWESAEAVRELDNVFSHVPPPPPPVP